MSGTGGLAGVGFGDLDVGSAKDGLRREGQLAPQRIGTLTRARGDDGPGQVEGGRSMDGPGQPARWDERSQVADGGDHTQHPSDQHPHRPPARTLVGSRPDPRHDDGQTETSGRQPGRRQAQSMGPRRRPASCRNPMAAAVSTTAK